MTVPGGPWGYTYDASLGTLPGAQGWTAGASGTASAAIVGSLLEVDAGTGFYTVARLGVPVAGAQAVFALTVDSGATVSLGFAVSGTGATFAFHDDGIWTGGGLTQLAAFDATVQHDYKILLTGSLWRFYVDDNLVHVDSRTAAGSDGFGLQFQSGTASLAYIGFDLQAGRTAVGRIRWPRA